MLKIDIDKIFDVVIVGSGLGGLVSALILAKEGKSVCVLEKNNQYGGNLQTFVRDKTIFDTGVHYIGGLDKGQNLNTYFSYLGIRNDLKLKKLDLDCFDAVYFKNDDKTYKLAIGYDNFYNQLSQDFPDEVIAINKYINDVKNTCSKFPLYNVSLNGSYDSSIFEIGLLDYLNSITKNKKLQAVLCGNSILYAGHDKIPFYVHALIQNSYIESAYRCINGGSQITKYLVRQLRNYNVSIFKHAEVVNFSVTDQTINSVTLKDNSKIKAEIFISNIDPKTTLKLIGKEHFKNAYYNRIINLEDTISSFSVFIKLKPNRIPYINHNLYIHNDYSDAFNAEPISNYAPKYLISMNCIEENQQFAESLTLLSYMSFSQVEKWEQTNNTVSKPNYRGTEYLAFKENFSKTLINQLEEIFPSIQSSIQAIYTTTPLSYRDYIGVNNGSLYGPVKDHTNPLKHFIATKSKIDNLYFTGQGVNMHGILGVTIGAVATCGEILGADYLISKIKANAKKNN